MRTTRHEQTTEELRQHLDDQLQLLQLSADSFDRGIEAEAKRIAVSLRVLLHDTDRSISLLTQLGAKDRTFLDSSFPFDERNLAGHCGLVAMTLGPDGGGYAAFLDHTPTPPVERDFEAWWSQCVFLDTQQRPISRRDLVLWVANQDGGAHVDATLNRSYADLSRNNSLGWIFSDGTNTEPFSGPEKAALRQVCHEVLKSLVPGYHKALPASAAFGLVAGMEMHIEDGDAVPPTRPVAKYGKLGRNVRCPCDSGQKYKHCCGRT